MKTVIEAGHYYQVTGPSKSSMKGWGIGKKLAAEIDAELVLFVDDYHKTQDYLEPGDSFLTPEEQTAALQVMSMEADHMFSEASIASGAASQAIKLHQSGKIKHKKGVLSWNGSRLGSTDAGELSTLQPTCVFLDYLFLEQKTTLAAEQIVVLPDIYIPEQQQLGAMLGALTIPGLVSYTGVFFDIQSDAIQAQELYHV